MCSDMWLYTQFNYFLIYLIKCILYTTDDQTFGCIYTGNKYIWYSHSKM